MQDKKQMNDKKQLYLIALISAPALGALVQAMAGDALFSIRDFPSALLSVLLVFAWYRLDTNARGIERHIRGNCVFVCFTVLALPVYLFKTRGWLQGAKATLIFFALMIAWSLLEELGAWLIRLIRPGEF